MLVQGEIIKIGHTVLTIQVKGFCHLVEHLGLIWVFS